MSLTSILFEDQHYVAIWLSGERNPGLIVETKRRRDNTKRHFPADTSEEWRQAIAGAVAAGDGEEASALCRALIAC